MPCISGYVKSHATVLFVCTVGVLISTAPNPDNFANFSTASGQQQLVVQYFETSGEGSFCAPIDISAAGIAGVKNGVNATLQFVFDGGDGELYQVRVCRPHRIDTNGHADLIVAL